MAFTYSEQPQLVAQNQGGTQSVQQVFRGYYADLQTLAGTYTIGTSAYGTLKLRDIRLERGVGSTGTLTLTFGEIEQGGGSGTSATRTGVRWSMKHSQKMVSIYRYCGDSLGASANRGRIEQWRKGTDAYLFENFSWRDKVGAVHTLSGRDQMLAAKFRAGFESVMRFYPTIQCVETFTKGTISNIGAGLAHITAAADIKDTAGGAAPTGWTSAAAAWLKIGDDVTFDAGSGTQTRTQSWLGEEAFDTNFYGEPDAGNPDNGRWDWGTI